MDSHDITMEQNETDLVYTQVLDAPRELVFRVFSEPAHLREWWGPKGWTMPLCTIDFHEGGEWRYGIRNAEGEEHWSTAVYREIEPNERIVFTDNATNAAGEVIEYVPARRVTITFTEAAGKTTLRIRFAVQTNDELKQLIRLGFARVFPQTLVKMAQIVRTMAEEEK